MTNFLYTDRISGLLKEGQVDMSKADFIYLINTAEIFHMPYGDCIKLGDSFIHSIILGGWRWDATTKGWWALPEGEVLKQETPASHALLTTETKPPLGIMPKKFWLEKRIDDLKEAVIRCIRVGRVDMNMVKKLLDEIVDTEVELAVHEAKEVK